MKTFISILFSLFCSISINAATYSYSPSQISALKEKLNGKLGAGDIVYLENGTYTDVQVVFTGSGTKTNPITLKARNEGKVILTGSLNLRIGGSYMIVDGLVFKDGRSSNGDIVEFRSSTSSYANNCRLTNCVIDNCNHPDSKYKNDASERWVCIYGKNNRVDHCYFVNKTNGGVLLMVDLVTDACRENNHLIDHNFFGYHEKFAIGNNAETIRIGVSGTSQYSSKTTVDRNFFYTCNGEIEIISIKSCDNVISNNTFYESQGGVVCRHGHRNTIHSNLFIGNKINNCAGIRVINQGHKIYNNFLQEITGSSSRSALSIMMGVFEKPDENTDFTKEPLSSYHRVKDIDIYENTFVYCNYLDWGISSSCTYSDDSPYLPGVTITGTLEPQNCKVSNNIFFNPNVETMLKKSGNTSGIICSNNLYNFKKTESTSGFVKSTNLNYQKITSGEGKGLYLKAEDGLDKLPNTATPAVCGTSWYKNQQDEMNVIAGKTIFRSTSSSIERFDIEKDIMIHKESKYLYSITSSSEIKNIVIYSMQGQLIDVQTINNNSGNINCPYAAGIYILLIYTQDGTIRKKIIIS